MSDSPPESDLSGALQAFDSAHERPVRFSSQAGAAITAAWTGVLGGVLAALVGQWWTIAVIVVGIVVSWTSWLAARRRGTLQPFFPVLLPALLGRDAWRSLGPVLRGRAVPSSPARRALAEAVVAHQRSSTAALTWPLVGMALTLLGLALAVGQWWLVWFWVAVVVFVALCVVVERTRNRRVDRMLQQDD